MHYDFYELRYFSYVLTKTLNTQWIIKKQMVVKVKTKMFPLQWLQLNDKMYCFYMPFTTTHRSIC